MRIVIGFLTCIFCTSLWGFSQTTTTTGTSAPSPAKSSFSLKDAVSFALDNNLNAQNADLDLQISKHFIMENIATGLPQISGNVNYQYNVASPVFVFPNVFGGNPDEFVAIPAAPLNSMTASLNASMQVLNGQYFIGIETAKVFGELSDVQQRKTDQEVKESVIKSYYLVLIAEESLRLLDSSLILVNKSLQETEAYYKEGLVEELDVEQLRLISNNTNDAFISTKNSLAVALMSLKLQMGYPLNSEIILTDNLTSLIAENNFDLLVNALNDSVSVRNNIDYQLISKQLKLNQYQYKLQKASAYPSLSTSFQLSGNFFNNERWLFLGKGTQSVMGGAVWAFNLNVPLFSSWNRVSKLKQMKLEVEKTQNNQAFLEQGLYVQYVNSSNTIKDYYQRYLNNKASFELADKIRKVNAIKYGEGLASSLDLTQAESQFFESQQKYYQSLYDLLTAKITLNKILNTF